MINLINNHPNYFTQRNQSICYEDELIYPISNCSSSENDVNLRIGKE